MDLDPLRVELEQHRRPLAMLPPGAALSREDAIALIQRCLDLVAIARRGTPSG